MGWAQKTKPFKPAKKADKISFNNKGTSENSSVPNNSQQIEGYDYIEMEPKGRTLREQRDFKKAQDITSNSKLTESQKIEQLESMIENQRIHKKKFSDEKERKIHLRDLDKQDKSLTKDINGHTVHKYTDGHFRTE